MSKRKASENGKKLARHDNSLPGDGGSTKLIIAVTHKNEGQKQALRSISQNKITFISGVAGSGKTHIAVGWGLQEMLMHDRFDKLILTRPVVEAGESLGFLPGSAEDKIAPYMMPIFDILSQYVSDETIRELIEAKKVIILPIAYMRGRTFRKSYVVMDEAQNCTTQQMHLLLTRMGEDSKIVVTGDTEQSDLCYQRIKGDNGLQDAISRLKGIENIGFIELGYESCVRDPIINEIDAKYRIRKFELKKWNEAKASDEDSNREPKIFDYDQ